jgi:ketopantoate reductase
MKYIFIVSEQRQETDHDGWKEWIGSTNISYHQTFEGANDKVKKLLDIKHKEVEKLVEWNPDIPAEHWVKMRENIMANILDEKEGDSIYSIGKVELED